MIKKRLPFVALALLAGAFLALPAQQKEVKKTTSREQQVIRAQLPRRGGDLPDRHPGQHPAG